MNTETDRLRIRVPYAGHPPSINVALRSFGTATAEACAPWRDNTITAARSYARRHRLNFPLPPSLIRVTCPVATNIRRDPHNWTGTLTKACVDGLVRAHYWPDDTPEWVTVLDPRFVKIAGLNNPTTGLAARAQALIDIVPIARLTAALDGHPDLVDLFNPAG